MKPRLLDLFCGAGGAGAGYHRAGFEVVGVDIKPQPRYPFELFQWDATKLLRGLLEASPERHEPTRLRLGRFDAIHASPPCQRYSDLAKRNRNADQHPDLIGPVRDLLEQTELPYVIENVEGAPLRDPTLICGTERGLRLEREKFRLRRHRLFETNWPLETYGCRCKRLTTSYDNWPVLDVSGGGPTHAPRTDGAGGRTYKGTADQARRIMGIDWITKAELNEAIPPAYTELIGHQLMQHLQRAAA